MRCNFGGKVRRVLGELYHFFWGGGWKKSGKGGGKSISGFVVVRRSTCNYTFVNRDIQNHSHRTDIDCQLLKEKNHFFFDSFYLINGKKLVPVGN